MQHNSSFALKLIGGILFILSALFILIGLRSFNKNIPTKQTFYLKDAQKIQAGSKDVKQYVIQIAKNWKYTRSKSDDKLDILTITKGDYKIEIYQKNTTESLSCNVIFANNSNVLGTSTKASFVDVTGDNGIFRRSIIPPNPNAQKTSNTLCEKTSQGYNIPTQYGVIDYETPIDANQKILQEMDAMIKTLQ